MTREVVSRRVLLGGAMALGAGAALGPRPVAARTRARPDPGTPQRVIVVGAGLAGLTAALDLRDAGWDVVVLEARRRVGGRVHTVREPFTDGLHAEAGGESIDDNHDAIQAMVRRFGLRTERRPAVRDASAIVYYRRHRETAGQFTARRGGAVLREYTGFDGVVAKLAEGVDPEHPERAARAEALDHRTLASVLRDLHDSPEAQLLLTASYRGEYNSDLDKLSLLFVVQQYATTADVPLSAVETMRISGGNDQLPAAMAGVLGSAVVLGAPATSIEHGRDSVTVRAGGHRRTAAQLVLAVPPPVLRHVRFTPALDRGARAVIDTLRLGPATKVINQFPERTWRRDGSSGLVVTDLPFSVAWDASDSYPSVGGLLTAFTTGSPAQRFARLSDAARIAAVRRQLAEVLPEARPAGPAATVAWANEPLSTGGYAVFAPGQVTRLWPELRRAHGRIRFAGEHTETLAGYMESAIRSGHRVAREIGPPPPSA